MEEQKQVIEMKVPPGSWEPQPCSAEFIWREETQGAWNGKSQEVNLLTKKQDAT